MAKVKKTATKKITEYRHLLIPSAVGGVVAWIYSGGSFDFGVVIFITVWIGAWFGYSVVNKK